MPKNKTILIFGLGIFFLSYFSPVSAQSEFIYDAKNKRNPFIPLVTPDGRLLKLENEEGQTPGLSLEGVIYDNYGVSYALVNGEPVKVGDMAGEYQVLKIEKRKVTFVKEGQTLEIELKKEGEE